MIPTSARRRIEKKTTSQSSCHGTTSLLSFPIFVCPLPHLCHLPTPSNLVRLPSTASAPTPRCTWTSLRLTSDLLGPDPHAKGYHLYTSYNLSDPFFIINNG